MVCTMGFFRFLNALFGFPEEERKKQSSGSTHNEHKPKQQTNAQHPSPQPTSHTPPIHHTRPMPIEHKPTPTPTPHGSTHNEHEPTPPSHYIRPMPIPPNPIVHEPTPSPQPVTHNSSTNNEHKPTPTPQLTLPKPIIVPTPTPLGAPQSTSKLPTPPGLHRTPLPILPIHRTPPSHGSGSANSSGSTNNEHKSKQQTSHSSEANNENNPTPTPQPTPSNSSGSTNNEYNPEQQTNAQQWITQWYTPTITPTINLPQMGQTQQTTEQQTSYTIQDLLYAIQIGNLTQAMEILNNLISNGQISQSTANLANTVIEGLTKLGMQNRPISNVLSYLVNLFQRLYQNYIRTGIMPDKLTELANLINAIIRLFPQYSALVPPNVKAEINRLTVLQGGGIGTIPAVFYQATEEQRPIPNIIVQ